VIALPHVLDQVATGTFQLALLYTEHGLRFHLQDKRSGQDAWLSPEGAQTLAGIFALHPFPFSIVALGDQAYACSSVIEVQVLQDGFSVSIPAHCIHPIRHLLEELERTRSLFDAL
jgi:hypothetical protein